MPRDKAKPPSLWWCTATRPFSRPASTALSRLGSKLEGFFGSHEPARDGGRGPGREREFLFPSTRPSVRHMGRRARGEEKVAGIRTLKTRRGTRRKGPTAVCASASASAAEDCAGSPRVRQAERVWLHEKSTHVRSTTCVNGGGGMEWELLRVQSSSCSKTTVA